MKISKINAEEPTKNTESKEVNFQAIKLNRSSLKMAKPLAKDTLELRKTLPDNQLAKEKKYFGNPDVGPGPNGSGNHDFDGKDAAFAAALIGAGIALALL